MPGYHRILIIKLGALGDVVQADGAYRAIREHHPEADLTVLTTPPYRSFFARCPWVDRVVLDPRAPRWNPAAMLSLRRRLRRLAPDMVYDLQQVKRTHFYFRWFLADVDWLGKAPGCRYRFFHVPGRCALDQFADQFAALGIANDHVRSADLSWMADEMGPLLRRRGVEAPYAVLVPGTSAAAGRRRWPRYDELAGWLAGRGITPVVVPGPDEMDLCRTMVNPVLLLEDDGSCLDIFRLAGVMRTAAFVVGNDTGPIHIAANLRRPGLALYGAGPAPTTTGIQHSRLHWLAVPDLQELPLAAVTEEIEARLAGAMAAV